jgi:3-phosphoshikimate 1-carboxyvinyltransferase
MALSLAGMAADGESVIETAEAINVTFPDYVELMKSLGAKMELVD